MSRLLERLQRPEPALSLTRGNYDTITIKDCGIGEEQGKKIIKVLDALTKGQDSTGAKLDEILAILMRPIKITASESIAIPAQVPGGHRLRGSPVWLPQLEHESFPPVQHRWVDGPDSECCAGARHGRHPSQHSRLCPDDPVGRNRRRHREPDPEVRLVAGCRATKRNPQWEPDQCQYGRASSHRSIYADWPL
jgi:hypothetical protein